MENPRKIQSVNKPEVIINLENGSYYYNYDIKEIKVEVVDTETSEIKEESRWEYIQVLLMGVPKYSEIVQAIIRVFVTQNQEFDLINSYNKAISLNHTEDKAITEYFEYLDMLETIKQNIKNSFE